MQLPPLGLYVHLPWCERKCPYCDFNSHEREELPERAYIDALISDLRQELRGEQRHISSVFIGGGTPSLFGVNSLQRLLDALRSEADLAIDAEISMEANPGSVESSRLAGYAAAGVTRFSLGIQSFDNRALEALGRVHDADAARAALSAARQSGAQSFNLDLMHGLPAQELESGLADIRTAIAASPQHLSWYQLTIEPNTRFYREPPLLPVEETLADLEEQGSALLAGAGYRRYEVSAWAMPGYECRHNLNYWRFGDYLAIGAGAHGKVTSAAGEIVRYSKTRAPDDYLAQGGTLRRGLRSLDAADRRGEFMLNALRLESGFTLALFEERTGLPPTEITTLIEEQTHRGLLLKDSGTIRCTPLGRRFLDDLVGAFFSDGGRQA